MSQTAEPVAWGVQCPKGHDYDWMWFAERFDAEAQAWDFWSINPTDDPDYWPVIFPLYRGEDIELELDDAG